MKIKSHHIPGILILLFAAVYIFVGFLTPLLIVQEEYTCWDGSKWDGSRFESINQCLNKPTLSSQDMIIFADWSTENRRPCYEYDEGRGYLSIEYNRNLREKPYEYRCVVKVDGRLQQYALNGGPVERGTAIQGANINTPIQGANIFEDHKIELCCFLGESTGKKYSDGNDIYAPLTDEICVEDTLQKLC